MQRRESELAVAQTGRRQPVFIERQPRGNNIGNALMKTGDEEASNTGIDHNSGITSDNVTLNATAAILVGGQARRFGGLHKPSLRIGDRTIVERQIRALRGAGLEHIVLVGRWPGARVRGVHHVGDAVPDAGALAGLYSALLVARNTNVVVLAGDMPFVTPQILRYLISVGDGDAVVPYVERRWHPLCAVYRRHIATHIKGRINRGALRVTDALSDLRVRPVTSTELATVDPDGVVLLNVNTPDDFAQARDRAPDR